MERNTAHMQDPSLDIGQGIPPVVGFAMANQQNVG